MHIFLPEIIYNEVKQDTKYLEITKRVTDQLDSKMNCIIEYNELVNNQEIYNEINDYMKQNLSDKNLKIWECFCADVTYNDDQDGWQQTEDIIQTHKRDVDLDVKMYAYYMELANTQDHESERWINNIEESIKIWENNQDKTFDPRLYTKYYWDKHEQFCFHLKEKKTSVIDAFQEYTKIDAEIKKFLRTKHESDYFWNIINHKTLYTIVMFWGSINNRTLDDKHDSERVLAALDTKIFTLPNYKYNSFNMHLMEWLWINFKWLMDTKQINKAMMVWEIIMNTLHESTKNKPNMIKALNHHNFSYLANFLLHVTNLREIEKMFVNSIPGFQERLPNMNWTQSEFDVINKVTPQNLKGERLITITNNASNMVNPIRNLFK